MTGVEMNIEIARACPELFYTLGQGVYWHMPHGYPRGYKEVDIQDDLRAMHSAWLSLDEQKQWEFCCNLGDIIERDYPELDINLRHALEVNATPRQRAEAFLMTIGKLKGES